MSINRNGTILGIKYFRVIWKGVIVPGLTDGNTVICMDSRVQDGFEIKQCTVDRRGLGAHRETPNKLVQGHMKWGLFKTRLASKKADLEERLRGMSIQRWAGKIFR